MLPTLNMQSEASFETSTEFSKCNKANFSAFQNVLKRLLFYLSAVTLLRKMLRPIVTLDLPSTTITELHKKGFLHVEDLLNNPGNTYFLFIFSTLNIQIFYNQSMNSSNFQSIWKNST